MTKWWARSLTFHCLNDHNSNYSKFKSLNLFSFPWVVYYRDNQLQTWRFSGLPLQGLVVSMLGWEEMVLGEGRLSWGLWKSGCPFQTVLTKDLPGKNSWLWNTGMGTIEGDKWSNRDKNLHAGVGPTGWSTLEFFPCVFFHIWPGFLGSLLMALTFFCGAGGHR